MSVEAKKQDCAKRQLFLTTISSLAAAALSPTKEVPMIDLTGMILFLVLRFSSLPEKIGKL